MRCLRLHPAAPGLRLSISTILVCVVPNLAMLRNITIDDEAGDSISGFLPGYSPVNGWTQGASCTGCAAQPDPIRAFNGTWHDATHHPGDASDRVVSLQFTGTAIYTFFIVPNTLAEGVTTFVNLTFNLDGEHAGEFQHKPSSERGYLYNVMGYANDLIPAGRHQLNIVATGDNASIFLFDYAIYTVDVDDGSPAPTDRASSASLYSTRTVSTTNTNNGGAESTRPLSTETGSTTDSNKHSSNIALIVGTAIGCVMSLLLIAALLLCYCRKRQNKQELDHMKQVRSYVVQPSPRSASLTITNAKTLVSYKMTSVKLRQQEHAYFHEKETARNSATHSDLLPYSTVAEASSFQEHPQEQDLERRIEDTKSALETISRSMTSSDVGRRRKWQRRNTPGLSEAAETATLRQQIVELQAELEQMRRQREHLQVIDMIREREALPSYSESVRA